MRKSQVTTDRKIVVAAKLKQAGHMSAKRFKLFKATAAATAKRKKENWI
jgi:hypothetical protein